MTGLIKGVLSALKGFLSPNSNSSSQQQPSSSLSVEDSPYYYPNNYHQHQQQRLQFAHNNQNNNYSYQFGQFSSNNNHRAPPPPLTKLQSSYFSQPSSFGLPAAGSSSAAGNNKFGTGNNICRKRSAAFAFPHPSTSGTVNLQISDDEDDDTISPSAKRYLSSSSRVAAGATTTTVSTAAINAFPSSCLLNNHRVDIATFKSLCPATTMWSQNRESRPLTKLSVAPEYRKHIKPPTKGETITISDDDEDEAEIVERNHKPLPPPVSANAVGGRYQKSAYFPAAAASTTTTLISNGLPPSSSKSQSKSSTTSSSAIRSINIPIQLQQHQQQQQQSRSSSRRSSLNSSLSLSSLMTSGTPKSYDKMMNDLDRTIDETEQVRHHNSNSIAAANGVRRRIEQQSRKSVYTPSSGISRLFSNSSSTAAARPMSAFQKRTSLAGVGGAGAGTAAEQLRKRVEGQSVALAASTPIFSSSLPSSGASTPLDDPASPLSAISVTRTISIDSNNSSSSSGNGNGSGSGAASSSRSSNRTKSSSDDDIRIVSEKIISPPNRARDQYYVNSLELETRQYEQRDRDWLIGLTKRYQDNTQLRSTLIDYERKNIEVLSKESELEKDIYEKIRRSLTITGVITLEPVPALLPEITPDMQKIIEGALKLRNDSEVLVTAFSIQITRADLKTLVPCQWLNDNVINTYMDMIAERSRTSKSRLIPKVHVFTTFFFPKLAKEGYSNVLKRWTRKVDLFSFDLLIFPIHLGVHWCCATADLRTKKLTFYDSLLGSHMMNLKKLLQYLSSEHMERKKEKLIESEWKLEVPKNIPVQENGSDCGVFTCKFAEYSSRDAPLTFKQENMNYFRHRMVYEIIKQELLFP